MKARPVMIMAGGTGGHVFPALAVAASLGERGVPVVWLGTSRGLEFRLVPAAGLPLETIGVAGLRGKGVVKLLAAPVMLTRALLEAASLLRRHRPRLVLGMGGFASGPGGLAARLLGIPLVIHEQNALPGLTNRWLARLAVRVLQAFPDSFPPERGALTVGNPVRREICDLPVPAQRLDGRRGPGRLLVVGGSQGALALNQLVPQALALMAPDQRPEVCHQAGGRQLEAARQAYAQAGVTAHLTPFIDDMAAAYGWADLALCRSGALTVAELAGAGLGSLLVPFPFAVDDHQTRNGRFLADAGAAQILPQQQLTPQLLAGQLQQLLADRPRLLTMAEAARALARPRAAEEVAAHCLEQALPAGRPQSVEKTL
ncbi:MAG: undecaprenyldiphospho-muramoylpentapeptide beta-N-acetylglucosaminyltransferase [Candidatus Competibacteraceae bacterium]|nr:undecaprenyldiphospho-muramoylpentapeptide beta-N-acetylglucosaminyltransferase [Candidatus Competibacteraceae bacterium]